MKTSLLFGLLFCAACGASNATSQTGTTSAALTSDSAEKKAEPSAAEKWAEAKVAADAKQAKASGEKQASGDPLAMQNDAMEQAAIPKIEMTPARQVRAHSRNELDSAMSVMKSAATVDEAAAKLTARLGKPSWTENGNRRIWVANAGAQCHRLILEADGSAEVETASKTEWRMLSATAKQNPCSGEIKRGIEK